MTKQQLVNEIALTTGYDRTSILRILEASMFHIKQSLENGNPVYMRGFGTFDVKVRAAKMARNICKNTAMFAPEHKIPAFKASPEFRAQLNKTTPEETNNKQ